MTVIELFKTKTIDEIAQTFADLHYDVPEGEKYRNINASDGIELDDTGKCPSRCINYMHGSYEDAWMEGMCELCEGEKCPYGIDRKLVWKERFIEWLNESI